jgi:hypothetical protein
MRSYAPVKLRELWNAGRWTGLFAVECTQRDDFDAWRRVVLANKNAVKYNCVYCKTML